MANKQAKNVLDVNKDIRNNTLQNNKGKYNLYGKEMDIIVGKRYGVYENEKNPSLFAQHSDILRYTYNGETEFSRKMKEEYGKDIENLKVYLQDNLKPSYKVNEYDGFGDYISYFLDTYGVEESYAGHLMGLMGVRDLAEEYAYDLAPNLRGKSAMDVINEILQYSDVKYAMRRDRVGIVKDINVAMAAMGQVTTNVNNYTGKETRMGLISNKMYGSTLLNAANFNSMRRTKYITSELETVYGNNLSNVYNLSSLFRISDEKGRIADPVTEDFITEIHSGNVFDYLLSINPDFTLPNGEYDWSTHINYGPENKYYGITKNNEYDDYITPVNEDWTILNSDKQINKGKTNDTFKTYSEGVEKGQGGWNLNNQETSDGYTLDVIKDVKDNNLLKKTNDFLINRRINTIISRFHDKDNQENGITQSSVYKNFGISHGRNLLNRDAYENGIPEVINGYTNPYCRVWTNHQQYSKMKHLIRPFTDDGNFMSINDIQGEWKMFRSEDGVQRLSDNTVLNKNGTVRITPTKEDGDIKKCMFSIENLAWRDVLIDNKGRYRITKDGELTQDNEAVLSEEQRGPNGGRIMWFPPYDLNFQETASAKWSENEFIGRGEPVFTYINSTRSGTLDFTILVDHPSALNYWAMNKDNSEENEQTLLRYFAGCENIIPDDDVVEQELIDIYSQPVVDPNEVEAEKDIIFYTFFPNNYSGVDNVNDAMDIIFGGHGTDKKVVELGEDKTAFLGYEMGVNPISITNFSITGKTNEDDIWYLENIYDLATAEKIYDDLSNFKLGVVDISEAHIANCDIKNYETYKKRLDDIENESEENEVRKGELLMEIDSLEDEISNLQDKEAILRSELDELTPNTSSYFSKMKEIETINSEIKLLEDKLSNKNQLYDNIPETPLDLSEVEEKIDMITDIFVNSQDTLKLNRGDSEFNKTNALYIYFDYTAASDNKINVMDNPAEAYAKYRANSSIKEYVVKDLSEKPYKLLSERSEIICKTSNKDGEKYWVVKCEEKSDNIPFVEFKNKREFTKSNVCFGKITGETCVYLLKHNGTVIEFKGVENEIHKNAVDYIETNEIIPIFNNINEFKESNEIYGKIGNKYCFYDIEETPLSNIETKIVDFLKYECDEKDDLIIQRYYEDHKFGCVDDFGYSKNYGVIQFFYTGKRQEEGNNYTTYQDFIAQHKLQLKADENEIKIIAEATTNEGDIKGEIKWDIKNPILSYPVDNGKESEVLKAFNYYDMESFGLNSTLDVVRKEMGDDNITFSFGEVFAALKGDKEKDFVLSCQRGVLANVLKLKDEEIGEKLKESEERIEYLKSVFNPKDGIKTKKITKFYTSGNASSPGTVNKNETLSKNRSKTLQTFFSGISVMKDIEHADETSNYEEEKTPFNNDINNIVFKKACHARVRIVVGEDDNDVKSKNNEKLAEQQRRIEELKVKKKYRRYDNERLFFSMLKENDSVAYKRLIDKVKYFSPAYHSITPEGFNARLTFLHQCTRQGPTSSASDINGGSTASNLAFGRAPFCVLRLGDFLNTKIVITSINITYPDSMWDLNPDGIGVQFMMAKVSMQIHIIGGSDISAPIKRLQNAVSFNYYANTSIYDDRSDTAVYDENGKDIITKKQWFVDMDR